MKSKLCLIDCVITGGQTGADQGALRAARAAGVRTGGWAARGWDTEAGPDVNLQAFGLVQCPEPGYRARTLANVRDCDAVIWFGDQDTPGGRLTIKAAVDMDKPLFVFLSSTPPSAVAKWLVGLVPPPSEPTPAMPGCKVSVSTYTAICLMVAGNRESRNRGVGYGTELFMSRVFRILESGDLDEPDAKPAGQPATEAVRDGGPDAGPVGGEEARGGQ